MHTHLPYRGILEVSGSDRLPFLQGILTQDMQKLSKEPAVYALRLNRMGRILGDVWVIAKDENTWWVDTENPEELAKDWMAKKLRYKVSIIPLPDQHVFAFWGEQPPTESICIADSRAEGMGWRVYGNMQQDSNNLKGYRLHTLALGIPDGSLDLEIERAMPLPWGLEHAIGWEKGCYIGQEPVARSRYQGVVRQHIVPVYIQSKAEHLVDASGDITDSSGNKIGRFVSQFEDLGLALVSTEVTQKPLNVQLIAT